MDAGEEAVHVGLTRDADEQRPVALRPQPHLPDVERQVRRAVTTASRGDRGVARCARRRAVTAASRGAHGVARWSRRRAVRTASRGAHGVARWSRPCAVLTASRGGHGLARYACIPRDATAT